MASPCGKITTSRDCCKRMNELRTVGMGTEDQKEQDKNRTTISSGMRSSTDKMFENSPRVHATPPNDKTGKTSIGEITQSMQPIPEEPVEEGGEHRP